MKNETILFDTITPCPDPVHIGQLLTDIEAVIKRHVILGDHAAAALAVWVLHTYTFELRDTVAYVAIESPEKRCGKTTLLSVLAAMACKPLIASNVTLSALFRAIDTCSPTLFIDEADTFLAGNGAMRGIINSGNTRRAAYVLRLSASKKNLAPTASRLAPEDAHLSPAETHPGLRKFSCWCPKVIAMIDQVPDTIADRSIIVQMSRKLVTETCAPLAELNTTEIKSKCARFALDAATFIAQTPKFCADGLNDRAADTFDPLFVIARLAGEEWHRKLHTAALALCATADTEKSGSGLLLDIMDVFFDYGLEKMFSRDIVTMLRDGAMKSNVLKHSALNEQQLAKILRLYGIKSVTIRIGDRVQRGYLSSDFREAITRYVPRAELESRVEQIDHRLQLQVEADKEKALMKQALAEAAKKGPLSFPAAMAELQRLKKESETSDGNNGTSLSLNPIVP